MIRRLPPFAPLVAFDSVARHRSFTRAADELGVTQSAISHQIRRLEEFFGVPLLKRLNPVRQLDDEDLEKVVIRPEDQQWHPGLVSGLQVCALSEFGAQHTALVRWAPGTYFNAHRHFGGEEILVLEGTFQDEFGQYPSGSWVRSPHMSAHKPYSEAGCLIFVKVGHLL
jgi:hypothetical protein